MYYYISSRFRVAVPLLLEFVLRNTSGPVPAGGDCWCLMHSIGNSTSVRCGFSGIWAGVSIHGQLLPSWNRGQWVKVNSREGEQLTQILSGIKKENGYEKISDKESMSA